MKHKDVIDVKLKSDSPNQNENFQRKYLSQWHMMVCQVWAHESSPPCMQAIIYK